MAVYLVVEQVAGAYKRSHKGNRNHKPVESPEWVPFRRENREQYHGNHYAYGTAMTCQAAMPCVEYLDGMLREVIPLIEEAMAKTGAYDGGYHHIDQQHTEPFLGHTFMAEYPFHDFIAEIEPDDEHQPVPSYDERPEMEQFRVYRPGHEQICHNSS